MVGVLGSAFNPPHLGHLVLAQEAAWQLGLGELLLVPTGAAPHREIEDDPGAGARLEMARLAAALDPKLSASELETAREGPSFTYRTLELLARERPGAEPVLVLGADAAAGLGGWRRPERIVELARLAVAGRGGVERDEVAAALAGLGVSEGGGLVFLEMPAIGVSSSLVRERVREGRPIHHLVPDAVAELIAERGLYRRGSDGR